MTTLAEIETLLNQAINVRHRADRLNPTYRPLQFDEAVTTQHACNWAAGYVHDLYPDGQLPRPERDNTIIVPRYEDMSDDEILAGQIDRLRSALVEAVVAYLPETSHAVLAEHDGQHPDGFHRLVVDRAAGIVRDGIRGED